MRSDSLPSSTPGRRLRPVAGTWRLRVGKRYPRGPKPNAVPPIRLSPISTFNFLAMTAQPTFFSASMASSPALGHQNHASRHPCSRTQCPAPASRCPPPTEWGAERDLVSPSPLPLLCETTKWSLGTTTPARQGRTMVETLRLAVRWTVRGLESARPPGSPPLRWRANRSRRLGQARADTSPLTSLTHPLQLTLCARSPPSPPRPRAASSPRTGTHAQCSSHPHWPENGRPPVAPSSRLSSPDIRGAPPLSSATLPAL